MHALSLVVLIYAYSQLPLHRVCWILSLVPSSDILWPPWCASAQANRIWCGEHTISLQLSFSLSLKCTLKFMFCELSRITCAVLRYAQIHNSTHANLVLDGYTLNPHSMAPYLLLIRRYMRAEGSELSSLLHRDERYIPYYARAMSALKYYFL